jgi:predicted ATPase
MLDCPTDIEIGIPIRLTSLATSGVSGLPDTHIPLMPVTALVGPRGSGKSRLLAAIWWLLTGGPSLGDDDPRGGLRVEAEVEGGAQRRTIARGPGDAPHGTLPDCTLLLARDRLLGGPSTVPGQPELSPAEGIIAWLESRVEKGETGSVLLIEEPELDLNPQTQRYFYRVLRAFGERNQVIYSTRSPSFVDAVHHAEIVRLDITSDGMAVRRAAADLLTDEQRLRLAAEFDHERAEMFFANAVVLVEGETERQSLPIMFRSLGHDPDALGISITEVGGKSNLLLAARLLAELNIPHLLVYDSDRGRPGAGLNRSIARAIGTTPQIWLEPDFEGAAGIRGRRDKVFRAWLRFAHASPDQIPPIFHRIVDTAVRLARRLPLDD